MFIRAYLRGSTKEQDANRARVDLDSFAAGRGLRIAAYYVENESGATLRRPALFSLIEDSQAGDILLIEQVDRLSRLNAVDWEKLKRELQHRSIRVVALDLPTSWPAARAEVDEITSRILDAMNAMLLDMLAAIARKDYTDRRRRQAQGIEKARLAGRYKGRPENTARNAGITAMLRRGVPWSDIRRATGASRSTLARLRRQLDAVEPV